MSIIEWNDGFVLGIQPFDEHHKHLVGLLNRTYDEYFNESSAGFVGTILDELIDYARYHFELEESWMRENQYPKAGLHREEHERFFRKVVEMQKDFHHGKQNLLPEVLTFIKNWLSGHILTFDTDYGHYIAARFSPMIGDPGGRAGGDVE